MELTAQCRADLTKYGFEQNVPVKICSKCNKTPGEMAKIKEHPLEKELEAATNKSSNIKNDNNVKRLSRRMHDTSRCCAAPLKTVFGDYHLLLWQTWKNRKSIPPMMISGPPIDGIPSLRARYGPYEKYVDDDFILMWNALGLPDTRVGDIIRIFREEESRQAENVG